MREDGSDVESGAGFFQLKNAMKAWREAAEKGEALLHGAAEQRFEKSESYKGKWGGELTESQKKYDDLLNDILN